MNKFAPSALNKGFTLIELLVAVSIIAVLSTIGFTLFQGTQSKARDSVRKQDLNKLALALELYSQKNKAYVGGSETPSPSCSDHTPGFYNAIAPFISGSGVAKDPKTGEPYCYISVNNGKSFRLFAKLENCTAADSPLCSYSQYNYSIVSDDLTIASAPGDTLASTPIAPPPAPSGSPPPTSIAITTVDNNAAFYGTYQSHNQKVLANANGIFMTYLHQTANKDTPSEKNTWRLARSTNGGTTFTTIYEVTNAATRAPVIETDSGNNIYVVAANYSGNASFYKFSSSNNYSSPTVQTSLNLGTISAKYAMEIDETRSRLYFFTLGNTFTVINLSGSIINQFTLTQQGSSAHMHYPLLYLDENGHLYVGWTTVSNDGSLYWSIHFIRSRDGAVNWEKPTGLTTGQTLSRPITADQTGPSVRITLDDEYTAHTWLETLIVKSGKVHFMYLAREPLNRMHYVRYDLGTANIDRNIYPDFIGENISLHDYDGFCTIGAKIYCLGRANGTSPVAILRSDDNGTTWHDHAVAPSSGLSMYSLGGSPQITSDGYIIGSYTESADFSNDSVAKIVKFFKAPI